MNTAISSPLHVEMEVEHAEERALLDRILASRHFAKSALLSRFLRYICERSLLGAENGLTEHHIGVRVFGRPEGYDCSADNIVRNYARQLRNRLDDYYRWEGQAKFSDWKCPAAATSRSLCAFQWISFRGAEDPASTLQSSDIVTTQGGNPHVWPFVVLSVVIIALLGVVIALIRSRAPATRCRFVPHAFVVGKRLPRRP